MNINKFYTDVLGANPRNPRWSWGAVDPVANRVFLRLWEDDIESMLVGERIVLSRIQARSQSHGFAERRAHIARIRDGATAYAVLGCPLDPHTSGRRRIESFDDRILLVLGDITEEHGTIYAHISRRIAVSELARQQTDHGTVAGGLKALIRKKINATTKERLIDARIGQGVFREQVLALWDRRCAVTGATTPDALRASHIKPWRKSNDEERLNPHNGLPLVANMDALFDAGLISFKGDGQLLVSSLLPTKEQKKLGIQSQSLARTPNTKMAEY